jgi:hypothetical protein
LHIILHEAVGFLADQDRTWLGGGLEARRDVGGVADCRRVHPQIAANRAEHNKTGVDANADLQFRPSALASGAAVDNGFADCQRCQQCALRMILASYRRAEQCQKSVAGELRHGAFVAPHCSQCGVDKPANQLVHLFRAKALGHSG